MEWTFSENIFRDLSENCFWKFKKLIKSETWRKNCQSSSQKFCQSRFDWQLSVNWRTILREDFTPQMQIHDWDSDGSHDHIGAFNTTLTELLTAGKTPVSILTRIVNDVLLGLVNRQIRDSTARLAQSVKRLVQVGTSRPAGFFGIALE